MGTPEKPEKAIFTTAGLSHVLKTTGNCFIDTIDSVQALLKLSALTPRYRNLKDP